MLNKAFHVVSAAELAAADIVLTTYDVLRKDIHHEADPGTGVHNLRHAKAYEVCTSADLGLGLHVLLLLTVPQHALLSLSLSQAVDGRAMLRQKRSALGPA